MIHFGMAAFTLVWMAVNVYFWYAIKSQELLLAISAGLAVLYFVPFWFYISRDNSQ